MNVTRTIAIALALVSAPTLADAQSVISREVSNEPVETIITQGPNGITVTRRPMQTMAAPVVSTQPVFPSWGQTAFVPAAPTFGTVAVQPFTTVATAPVTTTVVVDEPVERRVVRTARRGTPPIMARGEDSEPRVRRTARRSTETIVVEQPRVYNTIVQQNTYDPALLPRVTPTYTTTYPAGYSGYAYSPDVTYVRRW